MKLFCFGLGYTAKHLRDELSLSSRHFSGTRKSEGNFRFDGNEPLENAAKILQDCTHLLISVPPNPQQIDPVLYHHKTDIENMPNLKWVGYLSATSVYGDHKGAWVDENSPTIPSNERGKLRLQAERQWLALNKPVHIFRLGGIYGPERNQIDAVKNGSAKKIINENNMFSRIHVDDICSGLKSSMENPSSHKIYNLVDDCPASTSDVLDFLCSELDLPPIEGIDINDPAISSALKSFYQDNKRVNNDLIKRELNWHPQFPSYKEGYRDILAKLSERSS
tara:strand:+ start:41345 stop:42181 length:837 start_codon:yes stop_codon:yes gene_type:complete